MEQTPAYKLNELARSMSFGERKALARLSNGGQWSTVDYLINEDERSVAGRGMAKIDPLGKMECNGPDGFCEYTTSSIKVTKIGLELGKHIRTGLFHKSERARMAEPPIEANPLYGIF